jgi:sugar phosphate isomerase/epimerase
MQLSRREFFAGSALAASGLLAAKPLGMPIGTQTFPVRKELGKDFQGTLKQLNALGYTSIEMCSPHSYKDGFETLANMSAAELKAAIRQAGMRCESCHYGFKELKEKLEERIAFAQGLGLKQMVLSSFGMPKTATMADWARAAGELNRIGEKITKAGLLAGFHNHHGEFEKLDGELIYDRLLKEFDPKLIKMQFQVAVISIGYQAAPYMLKYPGRFLSLHLADWSAQTKKGVAIGQGAVDWKALFAAAKTGGVKNYYVEMNMEFLKDSAEFLKKLK